MPREYSANEERNNPYETIYATPPSGSSFHNEVNVICKKIQFKLTLIREAVKNGPIEDDARALFQSKMEQLRKKVTTLKKIAPDRVFLPKTLRNLQSLLNGAERNINQINNLLSGKGGPVPKKLQF